MSRRSVRRRRWTIAASLSHEPGSASSPSPGIDLEAAARQHRDLLRRRPDSPAFEDRVFRHLEEHKQAYRIAEVFRFGTTLGCRADGALRAARDGSMVALEIKGALSWASACQAEWQLERCIFHYGPEHPWRGGLVIFERFSSRDWIRKGWEFWRDEHRHQPWRPQRFDLAQFIDGRLVGSPIDDRRKGRA